MRRLAGWFAVVALGGCGFGFHANGTVARTAPFHAHPSTIADYPEIPEAPAANLHAPWALVADSFVPYYPNPSAWIVLSEGFSRGTKWGVLQVTPLPETALAQAFRVALGGEDAAAGAPRVRVTGVVTDFQWYELLSGKDGKGDRIVGGRIASRLTVERLGGVVLFEHEQVTEGRTRSPNALIRAHVGAWIANAAFAQAVTTGGAP